MCINGRDKIGVRRQITMVRLSGFCTGSANLQGVLAKPSVCVIGAAKLLVETTKLAGERRRGFL